MTFTHGHSRSLTHFSRSLTLINTQSRSLTCSSSVAHTYLRSLTLTHAFLTLTHACLMLTHADSRSLTLTHVFLTVPHAQ